MGSAMENMPCEYCGGAVSEKQIRTYVYKRRHMLKRGFEPAKTGPFCSPGCSVDSRRRAYSSYVDQLAGMRGGTG